ncbi:MAG TPA: bifunctional ADP-heptose synthase [Chitinophagaceae bacterium]|nr:carbohydrate kinase [Chitinophagaceae bacterium]MCC6635034.1 carbohydrate kinase [Chitinophagaceae bacterium]HMZ46843.1 bifunctional ADP-heptose synthase [Chitinophagaceae bacterium]HNE93633.1 bifunctional ADP-heptose synthase [Chitinophagaceae bacterium]HNM34136.1 bifunctional ADP-heptose synthase [Chitinophagaceae bacterium]
MKFEELFRKIKQLKVGIVGDVMLDTYMWGNVERISPEAPVPIVSLKNKENRIGGAGNVALNCIALQANTHIFSVIGNDEDGNKLIQLLNENNIDTGGIIKSSNRITTNKLRIIARNQQMMRLDAEITNDINAIEECELLTKLELFIATQNPDVIIFEDYNKGVLTEKLIAKAIQLCKENDIITSVDPKHKNFFNFKGVTIFKPNFKETIEALGIVDNIISLEQLNKIHHQLKEKLQHHISFITLSEKGVYYNSGNEANLMEAHIRKIADVSGAGDTVIAVASLVYAASKNISLSTQIANIAGGLVCEQVGTVAINKMALMQEIYKLLVE